MKAETYKGRKIYFSETYNNFFGRNVYAYLKIGNGKGYRFLATGDSKYEAFRLAKNYIDDWSLRGRPTKTKRNMFEYY